MQKSSFNYNEINIKWTVCLYDVTHSDTVWSLKAGKYIHFRLVATVSPVNLDLGLSLLSKFKIRYLKSIKPVRFTTWLRDFWPILQKYYMYIYLTQTSFGGKWGGGGGGVRVRTQTVSLLKQRQPDCSRSWCTHSWFYLQPQWGVSVFVSMLNVYADLSVICRRLLQSASPQASVSPDCTLPTAGALSWCLINVQGDTPTNRWQSLFLDDK